MEYRSIADEAFKGKPFAKLRLQST